MKTWTKLWKSSTKPRKQRKYYYNLPLHLKSKILSAHLSKELRDTHKTRNLRVKKGDTVTITRGQYRGKTGTVERIDTKHTHVYITTIDRTKRDGSKTLYPIHPSKITIQTLASDKRRFPKATPHQEKQP